MPATCGSGLIHRSGTRRIAEVEVDADEGESKAVAGFESCACIAERCTSSELTITKIEMILRLMKTGSSPGRKNWDAAWSLREHVM